MARSGDSSSGSGLRAGSLVVRRFGDTYQFELDLPAAGGGVRPAIWSGSQRVGPQTWSALRQALESTAGSRLGRQQLGVRGTATQIAPGAIGDLEHLGGLIHREVLPDEVREELSRYAGPLLLATDDPSLPWELLHDGQDFLGLRHPVGRRLVVSRRRRGGGRHPSAVGGALLIGNPRGDLPEADREIDQLVELLTPLVACTVFKGPRASKAAVLAALESSSYGLIHFVGPVHFDADDPLRGGLVFGDREVLTSAELERAIEGEPFVFVNAAADDRDRPTFLGPQTVGLAAALASGGACGFIGTVWPGYNDGSRQLAVEFYRRVAEGIPAGEALRRARWAVRARRSEDTAWSSHVLFGDPGLAVIATARAAAIVLQPRVRFGPFVLEEEVGRGGMGVVWKAYQPSLERSVALKFLATSHGQEDQSHERFKREARVVARLRHPNLLQVYDFGEEQGFLYLATEYVPGGTAQDLLRREGPLPPERVVRLLGPVAGALDHLHEHGIVHRDVKPSNILLDDAGAPILADCGVARLLDEQSHMTATGAVVGTPAYMSPEQVAGQEAGPASDQYSLGVMAFEALTGSAPFEGRTPVATALAHLQQPPPSPRALNPSLSPSIEAVLLRVLGKRPEDRFSSCAAFVSALGEALASPIMPVIPTGDPLRMAPPDPSWRTEVPAAARPRPAPAAAAVQTPPPRPAPAGTPQPFDLPAWSGPSPTVQPATAPMAEPARSRSALPAVIGVAAILLALASVLYQMNLIPAIQGTQATATVTAEPAPAPIVTAATAADPAPAAAGAQAVAAASPVAGVAAKPTEIVQPTSVPTATTAAPTPTTAPPSATPLPPSQTDWSALLATLDGGVWANDLPRATTMLEDYLARYEDQNPPQIQDARLKLTAASIELGMRAVAAGDFEHARGRYRRALELKPGDALAEGELKKVNLWLDGDLAYREQNWPVAVAKFQELAAIDRAFGNAGEKAAAAQVELAKTWTPTPVPTPVPAPAYTAPAPANTAPAPAQRQAPAQQAPAQRQAPAQQAPAPRPAQPAPAQPAAPSGPPPRL